MSAEAKTMALAEVKGTPNPDAAMLGQLQMAVALCWTRMRHAQSDDVVCRELAITCVATADGEALSQAATIVDAMGGIISPYVNFTFGADNQFTIRWPPNIGAPKVFMASDLAAGSISAEPLVYALKDELIDLRAALSRTIDSLRDGSLLSERRRRDFADRLERVVCEADKGVRDAMKADACATAERNKDAPA